MPSDAQVKQRSLFILKGRFASLIIQLKAIVEDKYLPQELYSLVRAAQDSIAIANSIYSREVGWKVKK